MKPIHILSGICIAASLLSIAEARDTSPEILPGASGDDTAMLQKALSKCTDAHEPCKLRLGAGIFHTDVLLVKRFHGSIRGRGQGRTIIRPITSRPLRSTPAPFLDEPTLARPYPILLHFADARKVSISELTLEFPPEMKVMPYDYYGYADQPPLAEGITDSLLAAIQVDGVRDAELRMTHVTITATDNDSYSFSNIFGAVHFEGQLRFIGGVDQTRRLQRGRFVAHDNRIERTGRGFWVESADRGTFVAGNDLRAIDPRFEDIYLLPSSRDCRVIEPRDTVLDEGTNNQVQSEQ